MTPVIVIAVFVMAGALIFWNVGVMRRFQSEYRYVAGFQGKRYECILRFANLDHGMWCFLGADSSALYLLTASNRKRPWWSSSYIGVSNKIFKTDLRIPWTDLGWQEKPILLKECIWFEISAKKIYFYVPKDVGDKLLIDAGRKIQSEFDVKFQSEETMHS
ncbi:MAG: hypothetical protein ABSC33_07495 [Candidatus Sulfotelmatobacter sp.]|jgi:hypothetical protein